MALVVAGVIVGGALAAMDRTKGAMRRKLAWAATGAGGAMVLMLAIAPPDVWLVG